MADRRLTDVPQASSANDMDSVILVQSNSIKQITLSKLNVGSGNVDVQIEMRKYNGYVQWRQNSSSSWKNLFPLSDIDGVDGITPSFSIGTVQAVENGQPAKVEISGTKENVILNFKIPKGLNGTGSGDVTTSQLEAAIAAIKVPKSLNELTDDSTHRTVTDTEKTSWNNKSNFSGNYSDLTGKPTLLTETRVNELIDAKMPRSAEGVMY